MFELQQVRKEYTRDGVSINALNNLNLTIAPGEFLVIHGPSGSGKSTLLLMIGGMLTPTAGAVCYRGADLYRLPRRQRNRFRRTVTGFLFQKFYLLPYLSVYDNIRLPMLLRGNAASASERIQKLAERLGIAARLRHRPAELSVGEQQRAAMARALAAGPEIILADEPTGNLDKANRDIMADCFQEENRRGRTIVLTTHDEAMMTLGRRRILLRNGRLESGESGP
jgi:putative ABC transport system ATP-binding protein